MFERRQKGQENTPNRPAAVALNVLKYNQNVDHCYKYWNKTQMEINKFVSGSEIVGSH